jgi:hypothetical protein
VSVVLGEPAVVGEVPKLLLIGGEWREADSGARLAVTDPATIAER